MKYGAGPAVPVTPDDIALRGGAWATFEVDGSPLSAIEDLEESPASRAPARSDRLICVVVAVCAAVVCFGFAGRIWTSDGPASGIRADVAASSRPLGGASSAQSFALDEPTDGAIASAGRVHVHGEAHAAIDRVHVEIDLGSAVLGSTSLDVGAGGVVDGDVLLFEPSFDVPAAVVVSGRTLAGHAFDLSRTIKIRAGGPVTVWQWQIEPSSAGDTSRDLIADGGTSQDVIVDGSARSSIGEVSIDVETSAGRRIAHTTVPNTQDDDRAGSAGGALVGRRSFRAWIVVPGSMPPEGWVLRISWIDNAGGTKGSMNQVLLAVDRDGPR
jgi:hypothetical protein